MDFSQLPHVAKAAIGLGAVFIVYSIFTALTTGRRQAALKREKGALPAPAYPQWDKVFGSDIFWQNLQGFRQKHALDLTLRRFRTMGVNTYQFVMLGRRLHITIEPENLKTIQAVEFKKWGLGSRRKIGFRPLLGDGIFTTDGAAWQHSREMLRPNFVRSQIGDLATFETHVSHLINAIPRDGSTVDLSELFFRLTMDSATEFLFGESTETLVRGDGKGFADSFTRGQEHIAHGSRWGIWAKLLPFLFHDPQWQHDQKFVHDFVDRYVDLGQAKRAQLLQEKSNADKPGRYVFLDELCRQSTDRVRIRSELLNILLAGRDTTASLLTNVWWTMSKRPDIWQKVQAEVDQLNGEIPSWETLKDMKYVKALMNESLRLHPVVPANSREAFEDTTLPLGGGPDGNAPIFVRKGEVVVWSVYTMHRRKDYYGADAEEFRPERWLDDPTTGKKGLRPGWEYLPFNGGARICLGQQFALTEASYTTVRMVQAFSGIRSRDDLPWTEGITLTCVNTNGAKVAVTPRE